MPDSSVTQRVDALPGSTKRALCGLWEQLFKAPPLAQLRRDLMIPILAYRIQEEAFGSLSADSRRRLRQLARIFEADPNARISSAPGIKPGTRLVRQWRGQVHVVNVEEKGYEYKGTSYQSLSEIAGFITGTRWSGPLFFGLKGKRAAKSGEAP
jgi:Protein of unknown function (DUF2924)